MFNRSDSMSNELEKKRYAWYQCMISFVLWLLESYTWAVRTVKSTWAILSVSNRTNWDYRARRLVSKHTLSMISQDAVVWLMAYGTMVTTTNIAQAHRGSAFALNRAYSRWPLRRLISNTHASDRNLRTVQTWTSHQQIWWILSEWVEVVYVLPVGWIWDVDAALNLKRDCHRDIMQKMKIVDSQSRT